MLFGIDGDTIEERLEQAIEYMQEAIEEQEKRVQHDREELKNRASDFNSSYMDMDFISHNINDLNRNMQLKDTYEKWLMMLRIIKRTNKTK